MVRIPGSHPGGPGSIPGCGIFLSYILPKLNSAKDMCPDGRVIQNMDRIYDKMDI